MNVLITGGAGFVGVSLAKRLMDDNEITLLDINIDQNAYAFSGLQGNDHIKTVEADILDLPVVNKAIENAEVIIHTAAMVGVQEVLNDALYTLDVNYIGTSNLLKAASTSPDCKRIIVFSTSEIFGSGAFGVAEDGNTILSSVQDVRWCYCISKLAAEHLALSYYRQQNLPVVVVRPFNIFGPGRVGDHVVLRFIQRALKNENLEVYGDGTQIRAWCYISDFCDAILKCIENPSAVGQAFNIGNPLNTLTIYELAKRIIDLCDSNSKIVLKELDFVDIDVRVPNTAKARDILSYKPKVDLEEGLTNNIEWVKANIDALIAQSAAKRRKYVV